MHENLVHIQVYLQRASDAHPHLKVRDSHTVIRPVVSIRAEKVRQDSSNQFHCHQNTPR